MNTLDAITLPDDLVWPDELEWLPVEQTTDYATGVDSWQPTGGAPDDTVPYRFTVDLQDDNAAQGKTATGTFTWEA